MAKVFNLRGFAYLMLVLFFIAIAQIANCSEDDGIVIEEDVSANQKKDKMTSTVVKEDLTKQLPALFRDLVSSFRSTSPVILITSIAIGMLVSAILLESPLSSFPVPPLPYPPLGKFPPKEAAIPVHFHHYKPVGHNQNHRVDNRPVTSYQLQHGGGHEHRVYKPNNNHMYNYYSTRNGRLLDGHVMGLPEANVTINEPEMGEFEQFLSEEKDFKALTNRQLDEERTGNETIVVKIEQRVFTEALRTLGRFLSELDKLKCTTSHLII